VDVQLRLLDEVIVGEVAAHPRVAHHRAAHLHDAVRARHVVPDVVGHLQRGHALEPAWLGDAHEHVLPARGPEGHAHRRCLVGLPDGHGHLSGRGLGEHDPVGPVDDLACVLGALAPGLGGGRAEEGGLKEEDGHNKKFLHFQAPCGSLPCIWASCSWAIQSEGRSKSGFVFSGSTRNGATNARAGPVIS